MGPRGLFAHLIDARDTHLRNMTISDMRLSAMDHGWRSSNTVLTYPGVSPGGGCALIIRPAQSQPEYKACVLLLLIHSSIAGRALH